MISLAPVEFSIRELQQAYKSNCGLFVPCRGQYVIWDASYLDKSPHNQEDVLIRDQLFVFGDALQAHEIIDSIEDQLVEEDCSISLEDQLAEHFPECRKSQLLTLLELSENLKGEFTYFNDLRFDKDFLDGTLSPPPDYLEIDWLTIAKEYTSVATVIQRLKNSIST